MSKVLFVKANNRPADQAVSVQLYNVFLKSYKESHPNDDVTELDLYAENLPYMDADMIAGIFKAAQGYELTERERELAAVADKYLDQFLASDKIVFAFPLWNMTVPAVLHTYIDYLNRAGKTFRYTPEGPIGLATGKKAVLLNARGGVYSEGPAAAAEMAVNFVRRNLQQFGVEVVDEVIVEGHNQYPDRREAIVQEGLKKAAEAAAKF
ncbi:FMN-dependent NADH-azoreductase [Paenibacillus thermoaerophilus]|uniref:FMN dependent NADH:quinone oxidoreductase n=1 Tax=Paenibacillus thermoaerophilus TaxID=1215385 RepID=A0ABW2V5A3_9BACL|nr:FMN-dependent NADH-azoreductase [Paenibacillus thermoaerophilus]TMV17882.1 FMN-dependent NADH-azoreductase [Paenibacillus thermoaerophilus]